MYESWEDVNWWEAISPQALCTGLRISYPGEYEAIRRLFIE